MILAGIVADEDSESEASTQPGQQVVANIGGRVELGENTVSIIWEDVDERNTSFLPLPGYWW